MKVIAEVGSNWKTLEDCIDSIRIAKECGAEVVKFQYFNKFEMYGGDHVYDVSTPHLPTNWIPKLAASAEICDIEFMCTAFSPEGYKFIDRYVRTHKVASAEITDLDILNTVNSFKKPVYLSTGGASIEQIRTALDLLPDCKVTIMYCVTAYPAKVIDFNQIDFLRDTFGEKYDYGYSDHSIDVLNIPWIAKEYECTVIEKHVNFTDHTDTDDAPHSLNAKEFELMVKKVKGKHIFLEETFTPCGWQRVKTDQGYFRPRG